jgi:rhodanese-related sulfurtransferase
MPLQNLPEFIVNHWLLVLALITTLVSAGLPVDQGQQGFGGPLGATDLINRREAVVIDVRPLADFAQGHIINAINIPMNGFKNQIATLHKHKGKPIVIACRSGSQSAMACQQLRKEGFEEVLNLRGGIMAWQSANLPVTRKKR